MQAHQSSKYRSEILTKYLVEQFSPISIFLNQNLDILYVNGDTEGVLSMPKALIKFNIHKMMEREGAIIFSNCVDKTLSTGKRILYKNYPIKKNGEALYASFRFQEVAIKDVDQRIVLVQVQLYKEPLPEENVENESNDFINEEVQALENNIQRSENQAQLLLSRLETTSEELKTSNREILASNEKLISTNEELQSVNEELHTINSELQRKNEELVITKNDINNLLTSTDIGTLFLNSEWEIKKFNSAIQKHYPLEGKDIGRSIFNFTSNFENLDLEAIAKNVFHTLTVYEKEIQNRDGIFYLLRVLPYRTGQDTIKGVIVNFIDIDTLTKTRLKKEELANKYQTVFENSMDIVVALAEDGKVVNINKAIGKYNKEKFIGNQFDDVLPKKLGNKIKSALKKLSKTESIQKVNLTLSNKKQGKQRHFEVVFLPPNEGKKKNRTGRILVIFRDITESVQQMKTLEDSLVQYKAFMDNARQQIILVDKDAKIFYINYLLYGDQKHSVIGKNIAHYFPSEAAEKYQNYINTIFEGKEIDQKLTLSIPNKTGKMIEVEYLGMPITIEGKTEYVATISNVIVEME